MPCSVCGGRVGLVCRLRRGFGREAEVEQLDLAVTGDEDVLRLEIAMHDAAIVRGGEAAADLHGVIEDRRQRERRRPNARAERLSFEQLDRDVRDPVVAPDIVNREDVGVRQRGNGAGFAVEPLVEVRIGRRVRRQRLDRDLPLQPRIARAIHVAHAAMADRRRRFRRVRASVPGCIARPQITPKFRPLRASGRLARYGLVTNWRALNEADRARENGQARRFSRA